jgi:hypothetical protein
MRHLLEKNRAVLQDAKGPAYEFLSCRNVLKRSMRRSPGMKSFGARISERSKTMLQKH